MARLKVMLTDNGRTSSVRRQVPVTSMSDFTEAALSALCEVATELNIPGDKFAVSISEGEDEQDHEQKAPRAQAGGAGSGEGGDED